MAAILLRVLDASPPHQDPPRAPTVGPPRTIQDDDAVGALAARVRALELERARSTDAWPTARRAEGAQEPVDEDGARSTSWDAASVAEEEARVERKFAFLAEQVRSESVDHPWAAEAAGWIQAASDQFPGTRVLRMDCRSTLCQVEVEHEDSRASDQFLNFFFPHLPNLPRGALRRVRTGSGKLGSLVVLAREGDDLPRVEDP